MIFNKLKHWIVGSCGLDDYLAPCARFVCRPLPATCSSILKARSSLPKSGKVEKSVGVYHTHPP